MIALVSLCSLSSPIHPRLRLVSCVVLTTQCREVWIEGQPVVGNTLLCSCYYFGGVEVCTHINVRTEFLCWLSRTLFSLPFALDHSCTAGCQ